MLKFPIQSVTIEQAEVKSRGEVEDETNNDQGGELEQPICDYHSSDIGVIETELDILSHGTLETISDKEEMKEDKGLLKKSYISWGIIWDSSNIDDEVIAEHFTETELHEIDSTLIPQVPELSEEIANFLNKFTGKGDSERIEFGSNYDLNVNHDVDYILFALYGLVREIENSNIKNLNLEAWFNSHVWNIIVDQAFGDLDVVGESTSIASASRKNKKRKLGERRKLGCRNDFIIRSVSNGNKDEFGAGEVGKDWTDEFGTKFMQEAGLKLPKMLKDMLLKLIKKVDNVKCPEIKTVGVVHSGLMMMVVHVDNPKGYICRFQRGELMEVPDAPEKFPNILPILSSALNIKNVVRRTLNTVNSKPLSPQLFKNAGFRRNDYDQYQQDWLPTSITTPKLPTSIKTLKKKQRVSNAKPTLFKTKRLQIIQMNTNSNFYYTYY
nr:5488_t:CDS:10 [Entrophospora candida]